MHEHGYREQQHHEIRRHMHGTPDDLFDGCRHLEASIVALGTQGVLPQPQVLSLLGRITDVNATTSITASPPARTRTPRARTGYCVPRDLAKRWSVCVDKVLLFIRTGELRAFNVASPTSRRPRYRISIEEVRRFEEQTRSAAPPSTAKKKTLRRRKSSAATPAPRSYF